MGNLPTLPCHVKTSLLRSLLATFVHTDPWKSNWSRFFTGPREGVSAARSLGLFLEGVLLVASSLGLACLNSLLGHGPSPFASKVQLPVLSRYSP